MMRRSSDRMYGILSFVLTLALGGAVVAALAGGTLVPITAVLVIAFAKARFVVLDFMELREFRGGLALALLAWPALLLTLAFVRSVAVALPG